MKETFTTPCSSWREKLAATHPDDLTPMAYKQLQAHMATCATCTAIRAEYEAMGNAISQLPSVDHVPELSPALSALLNAQASSADETQRSERGSLASLGQFASSRSTLRMPRWTLATVLSPLAAVVVVVVLLGSFLTIIASRSSLGTGYPHSAKTWQVIPGANPGSTTSVLLSVVALSENDAWAVGFTSDTPVPQISQSQTLIEHWDGAHWRVVPSPNSPMAINILNNVVALAPNDVWAVGGTSSASHSDQILIEHWNGVQWSIVNTLDTTQQLKGQSQTFSRLLAISATDIWGVGTSGPPAGRSTTLIEHWNGTMWKIVPSPNPGSISNELRAIAAVSANDIWAMGYFSNHQGNDTAQTLIEHWDGKQWSIVSSPKVDAPSTTLNAAAAVSANDVWAIGTSSTSNGMMDQGLIEHWDGTRWSIVKGPASPTAEVLASLTALDSNDIWAAGISLKKSSDPGKTQGLTLHWDGYQWHSVSTPNPGRSAVISGIGKIPGSGSVWVVGYYVDAANKTSTLTMLYH